MQEARNHLLAGTGFAGHQDVDIGVCDLAQRAAQPFHRRRLADQRQAVLRLAGRLAQGAVLHHQAALFRRPSHTLHQPVGGERFGDEVVGSVLDRLDGNRDVAMAGDEDDGNVRVQAQDAVEKLQAIDLRHPDIGYHHPGKTGVEPGQRLGRHRKGRDRKPGKLQRLGGRLQEIAVVIDQDDRRCVVVGHAALAITLLLEDKW
jgi:hypothetical protein